MKKYFSFVMVALALCVLCFPSVQAQDPVPDPMFSPEAAPKPGAVKTVLAAGAYLNSPEFAQSLTSSTMFPNDSDLVNETTCTFLIWRSAPTPEYEWIGPGVDTSTSTDPTWAGDSTDFIRIKCVWYKMEGGWPSARMYRVREVPCGSRNFVLEEKKINPLSGGVPYLWVAVSPHPCGDPIPWYLGGGTVWCPPGPVGPCNPLTDPECEDCEGDDPGQGGGELP
jgi:hypothetical protein